MSKLLIVTMGVVGMLTLSMLVIGGSAIGVYNQEVSLRTTINQKQIDNKNEFDNLYKKISQVAQVSEKSMESLKDIVCGNADSRRSNGTQNLIVSWVKESVPNVDLSVYKNLQNIIVGARDAFTMRQKELLDVSREHNKLLRTFPSNIILGMFGKREIDITIVTSSKTEKTFETGKDEDVELFKKTIDVEK